MLRTPYNYDRDEVSKNTALVFNDESLAQQQFKDENNINLMIRKYGVLPMEKVDWGDYDATVIPQDYHQLQNMMKEADQAFMSLPADVRAQVDNDPVKFLAMLDEQKSIIKQQEKQAAVAAKKGYWIAARRDRSGRARPY
ncbi:portal protein [Marine gokushovirus]|nr:portal protein [Marine gokushovirus]